MDVYLDHHATTPCTPEVVEAMLPWFGERFGNAGSRSHRFGQQARTAVEHARGQLATAFGCSPKSLVFTSGATESDNLAILGVLRANRERGDHVVTVASEHAAVLDTVEAAEREGFRVTRLQPGPDGRIQPDQLAAALTEQTVLVSIMWVNNEVGTIQDLQALGEVCRARDVLFHTDAAQAPAWLPIELERLPVDLASFSAHKVYGPKGVGALYVRRGRPRVAIEPLVHGGGQERGIRSGTLPVPLIVGFGAALEQLDLGRVPEVARLRDRLFERLQEAGGVELNGSVDHRVAGNLNVFLRDLDVRALMLAVPTLAFSTGSACTSESLSPSHVLRALGHDSERAAGSIRLGLGHRTSEAEVVAAGDLLVEGIRRVRALRTI